MNSTLHIFNPEHDLALAANISNFTAPHAGRQLRSDLGYLPALWAADGDLVLVEDADAAWNAYRKLKLNYRPDVQFVTYDGLKAIACGCQPATTSSMSAIASQFQPASIAPWGWNIALRDRLLRAGIPAGLMPSDDTLQAIRTLSNRALAVELLHELAKDGLAACQDGTIVGQSEVCESYDAVMQFLDNHEETVVKAPWSSSGRGVRYLTKETLDDNARRWIANTLLRQGSIITEVKCRKAHDFAIEFMAAKDGTVQACGISLFTIERGAYTGNRLMPEDEKQAWLEQYIPAELLSTTIRRIEAFLSERIAGRYTGPLGVDMMVVSGERFVEDPSQVSTENSKLKTKNKKKSGNAYLNPCIEINLRRTMGHVALALSNQGHRGTMRIDFDGKNYHLRLASDTQ